jgi:oligopeptide transport system ATP-binding protein
MPSERSITVPPLLETRNLTVKFSRGLNFPFIQKHVLRAIDRINLALDPGEILGVVGESGSGKSTLARAILQLLSSKSGAVHWQGKDIREFSHRELMAFRRDAQIVFQDPSASLNPRMTLGQIISEPLRNFEKSLPNKAVRDLVAETMERAGLSQQLVNRYPHEISGGQCQRVGIARAVILKPRLLICDEPVSALDVSVQAQIVSLLRKLQREDGMAMIFISHDLAVVRHLCHRVLVVYMGRIVECAPRDTIFDAPKHPYTQSLLQSIPVPDPQRARARPRSAIRGEPASLLSPPSGCYFHTRCPHSSTQCSDSVPALKEYSPDNFVACHHPQDYEARTEQPQTI